MNWSFLQDGRGRSGLRDRRAGEGKICGSQKYKNYETGANQKPQLEDERHPVFLSPRQSEVQELRDGRQPEAAARRRAPPCIFVTALCFNQVILTVLRLYYDYLKCCIEGAFSLPTRDLFNCPCVNFCVRLWECAWNEIKKAVAVAKTL